VIFKGHLRYFKPINGQIQNYAINLVQGQVLLVTSLRAIR